VFALPTARIAVMGPAGREYVYKDEIVAIQKQYGKQIKAGATVAEAAKERDLALAKLSEKYEKQLMNPKEALSLGSVSSIVMPGTTRRVLAQNLGFLMSHYTPTAMGGVQREFE
jgi:acetyl-CoA carboxylase carboxyltransferase component